MYTSKDLQKIFQIGRETVRYYEKIGIIHGQINADNRYHYYSDLDIENLARILKYRGFKFPLHEIKKLHFTNRVDEFQNTLTDQINQLKAEIKLDEILTARLTWKNNELYSYSRDEKRFTKDSFYYDPAFSKGQGFVGNKNYSNFTNLSKTNNFPLSDFIAFTQLADNKWLTFDNGGTAISQRIANHLNIKTSQLIYYSYNCIYRDYRTISQEMTENLNIQTELAFLNEMRCQIVGHPYIRQIAFLKDKRIIQLNIPVQNNKR